MSASSTFGDPTGSQDDLAGHGTIAATLADGMLELSEAAAGGSSGGDWDDYNRWQARQPFSGASRKYEQ
jgi:hypothetical protein